MRSHVKGFVVAMSVTLGTCADGLGYNKLYQFFYQSVVEVRHGLRHCSYRVVTVVNFSGGFLVCGQSGDAGLCTLWGQ